MPRTPTRSQRVATPSLDGSGLAFQLRRLRRSDRFEMLAALRVASLLEDHPALAKKLGDRTLGDIVTLGQGINRTLALTKRDTRVVADLVRSFLSGTSEATTSEPSPRPRGDRVLSGLTPRAHQELPVLSSAECEQRLVETIGKLKRSPLFSLIAESRLADFWEPSAPRAPFEEAMTFRQLSEVKVSALLEKRSMGARKVIGIIAAIERAIAGATIPVPAAPPVGAPPPATSLRSFNWLITGAEPAPTARLIARGIEQELNADDAPVLLAETVIAIAPLLTMQEIATLWLVDVGGSEANRSILNLSGDEHTEQIVAIERKLRQALETRAPSLVESWRTVLRGAGVPENVLTRLAGASLSPAPGVVSTLVRILARCLGARPPIVFGSQVAEMLSLTPSAMQSALDALLSSLPKSDEEFRGLVGALLPHLEFERVTSLLMGRALYNQPRGVWVQGAGMVREKNDS